MLSVIIAHNATLRQGSVQVRCLAANLQQTEAKGGLEAELGGLPAVQFSVQCLSMVAQH